MAMPVVCVMMARGVDPLVLQLPSRVCKVWDYLPPSTGFGRRFLEGVNYEGSRRECVQLTPKTFKSGRMRPMQAG